MSFIPEETIKEIREKTDIVDVIGQYVQLTKRGSNYSCSCPFHEDRNPSFSIHSEKQIFKCFSCGRGGNVFSFLEYMEGISFPEAVQKAAEFSGITIDPSLISNTNNQNEKYSDILTIHEKTSSFYFYYLNQTYHGQAGLDYLANRSLDEKVIERFQIGLAPEQSELLSQYLLSEGYTNEQLINSGIFYQKDNGQLVDRFHGRLMFPLRNAQGKVVAFSGRVFTENNSDAKYLNSPETDIFQKNKLIFNLDLARPEIRRVKQVIICEGFMDVIRLDQNGILNSVATMGTSLTENHLEQLTKMAQEIVFIFDGDDAGQNATFRAYELTRKYKNQLFKSVRIPNKQDPDEWLQKHSGEELKLLVTNADNRFNFQREFLKSQYNLKDDQQLAQYIEKVIDLISGIISPIEQQLRIQDIVNEFGIDETIIKEQLARSKQSIPVINKSSNELPVQDLSTDQQLTNTPTRSYEIRSKRALEAEKLIIQMLIYHQDSWIYLEKNQMQVIFYHEIFQKLYFKLEYFYYDRGLAFPMTQLENELEDEIKDLYLNIIWEARMMDYDDSVLIDCFNVINVEFKQQEINEWKIKLKQYQQEGKQSEVFEAINHILQLTRQIKK